MIIQKANIIEYPFPFKTKAIILFNMLAIFEKNPLTKRWEPALNRVHLIEEKEEV